MLISEKISVTGLPRSSSMIGRMTPAMRRSNQGTACGHRDGDPRTSVPSPWRGLSLQPKTTAKISRRTAFGSPGNQRLPPRPISPLLPPPVPCASTHSTGRGPSCPGTSGTPSRTPQETASGCSRQTDPPVQGARQPRSEAQAEGREGTAWTIDRFHRPFFLACLPCHPELPTADYNPQRALMGLATHPEHGSSTWNS